MRPPSLLQPEVLKATLFTAAAAAADDTDPVLKEMGAALGALAARLETEFAARSQRQDARRGRYLVLSEWLVHLRERLSAEAALRHAAPERAQAAAQLLAALPFRALDEDYTVVRDAPLPGSLLAARALLGAAEASGAAIERLQLGPVLRELAAAVAAALREQPEDSADASAEHERRLSALLGEAGEQVGRLRAYVVVATGKLGRHGEDPARRQRLLQPLSQLPALPLPQSSAPPAPRAR